MRSVIGWMTLAGMLCGCGGASLKGAGEECVASSECAAGLVCDLGQSPPVCAGNVTPDATVVDADTSTDAASVDAPAIDAAVPDARVVDAAAVDAAVDAETDAPPDAI